MPPLFALENPFCVYHIGRKGYNLESIDESQNFGVVVGRCCDICNCLMNGAFGVLDHLVKNPEGIAAYLEDFITYPDHITGRTDLAVYFVDGRNLVVSEKGVSLVGWGKNNFFILPLFIIFLLFSLWCGPILGWFRI